MQTMTQEGAIAHFAQMMAPHTPVTTATPRALVDLASNFFDEVRISGTELEGGSDMLLLQWGHMNLMMPQTFTDYRLMTDEEIRKLPQRRCRYVSLERQVFYPGQADEPYSEHYQSGDEFDDYAVGFSLELIFGQAGDEKAGGNLWVDEPTELAAGMDKFFANSFVKEMLRRPPTHVNAWVGFIG